jgi:hypothetical protein
VEASHLQQVRDHGDALKARFFLAGSSQDIDIGVRHTFGAMLVTFGDD